MSILKKLKKAYDSIEIPQNLGYVVNKAISKEGSDKKIHTMKVFKILTSAVATSFALFVILLNTNESFAKSVENIPVISTLAEVFTVREYKEENETELIEAKVPAIRNTGNTELERKINDEISNEMDKLIEEAKTRARDYQKAVLETGGTLDNYVPMKLEIDYKITYQDEELVSFVITKTESLAAAYTEQYFYNLDLKNGKVLTLKDVLGEDYKEIVNKEVKKQIAEREKENPDNIYFSEEEGGFSSIRDEYQDFYIDENKKVTVVFQKYEIAAGYMGIQSFEIPNEILK